ncbi:hypothetical protein CERZMDRAFT_52864 [Cercospora zeae-maydis SCOH1-5]|uniref:PCI domain-containing protein n=1 Tax=Cercospora zeae-maydis SCOH1-5 TaxID=717836 RepID=A0A6A6F2L2_9PEZI|nr:hypothetical protein CERZMDRAFT_52864 [Cercospora zeae-maydis SCOH1-5]
MGDLPPPTFDLENWANNYDGTLLAFRLAHIAIRCPSLSRQALVMAIAKAKSGRDVQLYNRLTELAGNLGLSHLAVVDVEWASQKDEENRREQGRLESELRGYKNNLIRESIRMGQEDLATHLLETGGPIADPSNPQSMSTSGYNAAFQAFGKMRDYCTMPTHMNSMYLHLMYTSVLQAAQAQLNGGSANSQLGGLLSNATRLRNSGGKEEEMKQVIPIYHVGTGTAHLGLGDYRHAAAAFLKTPFAFHNQGTVLGQNFERTVANANDVAIYGGLCALATMTRDELVENVLGGSFRAFLELEPHMRKAITLYTTAKYQACIEILRRYYSDWSLDIFLGAKASNYPGSHVDHLFASIRQRSITAYFSSFSEVSLAALAATFPPQSTAPNAMEAEILSMIQNKTLDARLDVVNGVLIAPRTEIRAATHHEAKKTAEEVERTLLLRLHKVNMTLAGLEIPKAKSVWSELRGGAC